MDNYNTHPQSLLYMVPAQYIIGSESLLSWEEKHPNAKWIVLLGTISYDMYEQLCLDFDYTKYKRISFEDITIGDKLFENGHKGTNSEYCNIMVYDHSAKLPVLDKLLFGKDNDFIVSNGSIYSVGGETLYHMEEFAEIFIPNKVTHIADYTFANYENLHIVHFNTELKSIGKWAFCGTGIERIELPNSLITLEEGAFFMADLERIKLSESLDVIPDECFSLCALEELRIPKSVRNIGNRAFRSVWVSDIEIPERVEKIGYDAFEALDSISLPSTLREIAPDFYYEEGIDSPNYPPYITIHPNNPVFYSEDGTLLFKENGKIAIKNKYNGKNPSTRF